MAENACQVGTMADGGKTMLKCCMCGDVFDVGYEMPNGDYVCTCHSVAMNILHRCEGKKNKLKKAGRSDELMKRK